MALDDVAAEAPVGGEAALQIDFVADGERTEGRLLQRLVHGVKRHLAVGLRAPRSGRRR